MMLQVIVIGHGGVIVLALHLDGEERSLEGYTVHQVGIERRKNGIDSIVITTQIDAKITGQRGQSTATPIATREFRRQLDLTPIIIGNA